MKYVYIIFAWMLLAVVSPLTIVFILVQTAWAVSDSFMQRLADKVSE